MQVYINKYGATLKVKNGQFCVITAEGQQLLSMSKVKSIMLNRSVMVSAEAIASAVEREIDILFVERNGHPLCRVWSNRYGSIASIRKHQLAFSQSAGALKWVTAILQQKIENQSALLISLNKSDFSTERVINDTIQKMDSFRKKIANLQSDDISRVANTLRGWEGNASKLYFQCISQHLPELYQFEKRSRRPAKDIFNCLLNYAYGMLYSKIEGILIKAGLDPYIGIFHVDEYNRPVLVYDWIEKYRIWAEYPVIDLCLQKVVFKEFFDINEDGDYWLNDHGKSLLIQSVNDYLEEKVTLNRKSRTRNTHLRLDAEQLAAFFKK